MKDSLKKAQIKKTIGITSIIIIAIVIGAIVLAVAVTHSKSKTIHTSAEPNQKEVSQTNDTTEENVVEIGNLTSVSNVTEEELQKINKKELEEAKKKEEENKSNKDKNNKTSTTKNQNKYYIKVNYGAQVVNVYTYDKDGKYTVPVKAFVCSTGTETPRSGVYKIPAKITWCHMYGDVWAHYCSQIVGNILFHSVPYLERNNHTLEYWAYDKLGTKASMGCIRLTTRDAKWIYDNVSVGTKVEFYSSSNPGPLGKPSAQKISNAPGNLKWWDPTDPDPNNPWRTYKPATNASNNKNNTTTGNNQTGSSNKNEQAGNNQTESSNKNEQAGNNQTGSSNENEQAGNNQTESNNKNEQAGNEQTGSSNKNEQAGNNQIGSSNKNEQTSNNQTGSSNKNEQTGNNQTGSSNKNEQTGNNQTGSSNKNEQTGNNQTESNNKNEE